MTANAINSSAALLTANSLRRLLSLGLLLAMLAWMQAALAQDTAAANAEADQNNPVWLGLRESLFQQRPIASGDDAGLVLEAPARAEDAAIVPIAIRAGFEQSPERYLKTLYLIIDHNPSPLGAIFHFTPASGRVDIETRVRVDAYTWMRAIAELNTGELIMASRFVKASGGCSAPPGKDQAAAMASLGKMRLRVEGEALAGKPALAQLMISHPNNSGLVMDQLTRNYTPAYFVRRVQVRYREQPVLTAELDFSISENPNFRFHFLPDGEGELKAEVTDTRDLNFSSALAVSVPR